MRKEFVMRGQTASGETEVLNFGKYKQGYAYVMTEFTLYPSTNIGSNNIELCATVTADKGAAGVSPASVNFNDDGLIAVSMFNAATSPSYPIGFHTVVNDTFIITQNLILKVSDKDGGDPVNWQCRFKSVKMSAAEEAAVNYKQFAISDE